MVSLSCFQCDLVADRSRVGNESGWKRVVGNRGIVADEKACQVRVGGVKLSRYHDSMSMLDDSHMYKHTYTITSTHPSHILNTIPIPVHPPSVSFSASLNDSPSNVVLSSSMSSSLLFLFLLPTSSHGAISSAVNSPDQS